MKIEKLNDYQIRCTLTGDDLASRHIKLSELAYGSEKTKALFQDMMTQASADFGFETDDFPIMVEAIPLSSEKIVLIITKVDAPDELDTRFSEFSHFHTGDVDVIDADRNELLHPGIETPEELIRLLNQVKREFSEDDAEEDDADDSAEQAEQVCMFTFTDIDTAVRASRSIVSSFCGDSSLYKDTSSGDYVLFLHRSRHTCKEFGRITHTAGTFLKKHKCNPYIEAHYHEHAKPIIQKDAVSMLAGL